MTAGSVGVMLALSADARGEGRFSPPGARTEPQTGPFRVYMSPSGADNNSGLSPEEPVQSLARAQEVLQAAAPTTDVEVRIEQGVYIAPPTTWTFLVPGHTVTFLPIDYAYGAGADDIAGRPVFRGDGSSGFWLSAELPEGHPGGDAGLRFYYLQVDQYDLGGLKLDGGVVEVDGMQRPATEGHNNNVIVGMYFTRLGSRWAGTEHGFGGVDLVNSRNNLIVDNHFVRLENTGTGKGLMHGVYLAHHSMENTVRDNRFEMISGDPIRTRNDSNDNEVFHNAFQRTGEIAHFSDWFCDTECTQGNLRPRECASHGNVFRENEVESGYSGSEISQWHVAPGDLEYAGGTGCSNDDQPRVQTYDNR
ncbi:MAG TPA: hypothetical protein VIL37_10240 [Natronosporangium sp.]